MYILGVLPSGGAEGSYPKSNTSHLVKKIPRFFWIREHPLDLNNMSEERMSHKMEWYDITKFILILVMTYQTYSLLIGIS